MITEYQLYLDCFRAQGYTYAYSPDITHDGDTPVRSDYQQVGPAGRLLAPLRDPLHNKRLYENNCLPFSTTRLSR